MVSSEASISLTTDNEADVSISQALATDGQETSLQKSALDSAFLAGWEARRGWEVGYSMVKMPNKFEIMRFQAVNRVKNMISRTWKVQTEVINVIKEDYGK
jgi:hypothetical protein